MSLANCNYCNGLVNTDADPDSCTDDDKFMCENCRYDDDDDDDDDDDEDEDTKETDKERCLRWFEEDGGGCTCGHHQLISAQPDVGIFNEYLEDL